MFHLYITTAVSIMLAEIPSASQVEIHEYLQVAVGLSTYA